MNAPEALFATGRPRWRARTAMQQLGAAFHTELAAQPLPDPHWVACNWPLADELGLGPWLHGDAALALLAGHHAEAAGVQPLATVYSGHQFGAWAGQLGDGRALLLGEIDTPHGAQEIQLKGSGLTPYSRRGDGRAVLRSSIREYLCSEAMHALGVPTTRALALVGSALPVQRETVETAAVLTRVAPSFLRFGHFEHFAHTARDLDALRRLTDHVIDTAYPHCRDAAQPAAALLEAVAARTAELIAAWQALGFCHGVMNTDNMSILGLTIDYGPFGFLDAFDPGHICNHTDFSGRYAYARQPQVALWNLHALALALRPLLQGSDEDAQQHLGAALGTYPTTFARALDARMSAKFGLLEQREGDPELIDEGLRLMARDRVDYTITLRALCDFDSTPSATHTALRDLFIDRAAFDAWALRYARRLREQGMPDAERAARMRRSNPKYVLRNHLAEVAIQRAREGDFGEVERLARVLEQPFDEQPEHAGYAALPPDWAPHLEVSCSS